MTIARTMLLATSSGGASPPAGDAFPVITGVSTGGPASGGVASFPITMPSGVVPGEMLIVVFGCDGGSALSVGAGSGWSQLGQTTGNAGQTCCGDVFYKIAEGADSLTVACAVPERAAWVAYRVSGASVIFGAGNPGNNNPPSLSPVAGAAKYLWLAAVVEGNGVSGVSAAPTDYADLVTVSSGVANSGYPSTSVARRALEAGSEDPGAFAGAMAGIGLTIAFGSGAA